MPVKIHTFSEDWITPELIEGAKNYLDEHDNEVESEIDGGVSCPREAQKHILTRGLHITEAEAGQLLEVLFPGKKLSQGSLTQKIDQNTLSQGGISINTTHETPELIDEIQQGTASLLDMPNTEDVCKLLIQLLISKYEAFCNEHSITSDISRLEIPDSIKNTIIFTFQTNTGEVKNITFGIARFLINTNKKSPCGKYFETAFK